ncbi:MAG: TIGR02285 family protein [Rhizobacter sp.]
MQTLHALAIVFLALTSLRVSGQPAVDPARETIKWYSTHFPPYVNLSGQDQGHGAFQLVMKTLVKNLPQYQHRSVEASLPRVIESIKTTPDGCTVMLLRTKEREALMDFSARAHTHVLPNGMVTLRRKMDALRPHINERGEIRLDELLGSKKFKLALAQDRSWGEGIDPIVRKHAANLISISSTEVFASRLLKLTNQNEFDAIIGYAIELKYTVNELKLNQADYVVLPIAESSNLLPVSVSCSYSTQGKAILSAIDRLLSESLIVKQMDDFYRGLLDEETLRYYDKLLRQTREQK